MKKLLAALERMIQPEVDPEEEARRFFKRYGLFPKDPLGRDIAKIMQDGGKVFQKMTEAYKKNLSKIGSHRFEWGEWVEDQLERIGALPYDWDGYGAQPPSDETIASMRTLLTILRNCGVTPDKLLPSAAGGIEVSQRSNGRHAAVECLNSGTILFQFDDEIYESDSDVVLAAFAAQWNNHLQNGTGIYFERNQIFDVY